MPTGVIRRAVQRTLGLFGLRLVRAESPPDLLQEVFGGDLTVRAGPFRGMTYVDRAYGSAIYPKILGSYEERVQPWIEEILDRDYRRVLDIGCAEGYYAVGFAVRGIPEVLAYDIDPGARSAIAELASLNGVSDRIEIAGLCDFAELEARVDARTLVFCDIEGAEWDLLDPDAAPSLLDADILVETHERLRPGVVDHLMRTFEGSHRIEVVHDHYPTVARYPLVLEHPEHEETLLDEGRRPGMKWFWMRPRRAHDAPDAPEPHE